MSMVPIDQDGAVGSNMFWLYAWLSLCIFPSLCVSGCLCDMKLPCDYHSGNDCMLMYKALGAEFAFFLSENVAVSRCVLTDDV